MEGDDIKKFTKRTGLSFKDTTLLRQAFTHRSFLNEYKKKDLPGHNERLEFLGDAVLELVVTDHLYHTYPEKTEGDLTAYRAALVNTITLSQVATDLEMNNYLLLSKGEARDMGRARQYILANTFEAVVGAIYLDQGYKKALQFISANLFPLTDEIVKKRLWQDAKSHFQEKAQDKMSITPSYQILEERGPDHDKFFVTGVFLGNEKVGEGTGRSKQEAEQEAAKNALEAKGW